ncbi:testis-expressed protein 29 [Cavia porcellus]|uniref:testis-expressed protein 29 n=1 Tax=Cavia porcellus TaxID=10141 RepID=UPI002FE42367
MRYAPEIKKSPPHLLQMFAVCDIPLYAICDYNVSRDRCKELGCCFYKSVCYEKAVPVYVHVFSILLVVIAAAFIVTIVYKIVQERKKQREVQVEAATTEAGEEPGETSRAGSLKPTSGSVSKKSGASAEGEEVPGTEVEDAEG